VLLIKQFVMTLLKVHPQVSSVMMHSRISKCRCEFSRLIVIINWNRSV